MKYFSMFSAIGGFELGIQNAMSKQPATQGRRWGKNKTKIPVGYGSKSASQDGAYPTELCCVGCSEIDKYAIQIYQNHFKGVKNYGNAKDIIWKEVPDFDLLTAGFPCQSFSIAGKRGGFKDTRGTSFFEIARAISVKRPKLLLLENVKGLLSHDKGRTFGTILATLSELGYILEWQVLNSKNFGVPQNRERVFIIGHLRGESIRQVFPIEESNQVYSKKKSNVAYSLDANYPKGTARRSRTAIVYSYPHGGFKGGIKKLPNLRSHPGAIHNEVVLPLVRRLTPTECERLQGFPDGWTEDISDSQRYKCLGNAVTVPVVKMIIERLYKNER